jgi:hypothetical protein
MNFMFASITYDDQFFMWKFINYKLYDLCSPIIPGALSLFLLKNQLDSEPIILSTVIKKIYFTDHRIQGMNGSPEFFTRVRLAGF